MQNCADRRFYLAITLLLVCAELACNGTNAGNPAPPPTEAGGFNVGVADQTPTGAPIAWHLSGHLTGSWVTNICNPSTLCKGNTTSFNTNSPWPQHIFDGRAPAFWQGTAQTFDSCVDSSIFPNGAPWSGNVLGIHTTFVPLTCFPPFAGSAFFLSNSIPATWTVQGIGLTTNHGMPKINVFSVAKGLITSSLATAVATDGTTATFNFPKNSDGTALGAGEYGFLLQNQNSSGVFTEAGGNIFSIGTLDSSNTSPFGIDAINVVNDESCDWPNGCAHTHSVTTYPLFTLYNSGQVRSSFTSGTAAVGTQPVAIKAFAMEEDDHEHCVPFGKADEHCTTRATTYPHKALVANAGSGTVSVVTITAGLTGNGGTLAVTNTIGVGTQPVAIAIKQDEKKAYIANYGSSSLSEIDLSAMVQLRSANVGSSPSTVAMDPSGTSVWVGGLNFVEKVDLGTFTVTNTFPVTGQVNSLAIASGQNAFVYTMLANNNSSFLMQHASMSTGAILHTDYAYSIPVNSLYAQAIANAQSPPAWIMAGGPLVSANYGNRYVVEGTPTGFVVVDLQTNLEMLRGTTTSAVRGIATDPSQNLIYLTEPDSNGLLSVPMPPVQTN